jgi:hypothetical protein
VVSGHSGKRQVALYKVFGGKEHLFRSSDKNGYSIFLSYQTDDSSGRYPATGMAGVTVSLQSASSVLQSLVNNQLVVSLQLASSVLQSLVNNQLAVRRRALYRINIPTTTNV